MAFTRKPKYKDPEPGVPVPLAPMPATAPEPGPTQFAPVAEVLPPPPPSFKAPAPPAPAVKFYPGDREALEVQVKIITEAARRIASHPTDPLALRRDLVEIEKASKPALIILRRY